jgi:hypothetical protein
MFIAWGEAPGEESTQKTASLEIENRFINVFCETESGKFGVSN